MKKRKNLYYDESTIDYIEKYRDEKHLPTFSAALAAIVDEHKHRNEIDATAAVIKEIAKQTAKELSDTLTRIRLGANNADRNSDIIIMLLNTLLGYQQLSTLLTDDTPQLAKAREIEKERIKNFRQKKLDREAKRKGRLAEKQPAVVDDDLIL
ncbi:MAG TPA: hypothetical protein DHW78_10505 [Ruminococcaceae bacterium]|nr:hypothetical protein [Oscillospiraceae bacterium]